jgi:hypothetical protein
VSDFDQPLKPALLLKRCNPADFDFSTTETLPDIGLAIGQERAMEALQFGLSTTHEGFTLFALGPKTAAVEAVLVEVESYREQTEAIEEDVNQRQALAIDALRAEAQAQQIALIEMHAHFSFAPINEKAEALSPEDFQKLPMERQQALKEAIADFHARLQKIVRQFPAWQREAKEKLAALNHETAASAIRRLIDDLKTRYAVHTPLIQHLEALGNTLIDHSHEFITGHEDSKLPALGTSTTIRPPPALWLESPGQQRHDPWRARCLRRAASSRQPI